MHEQEVYKFATGICSRSQLCNNTLDTQIANSLGQQWRYLTALENQSNVGPSTIKVKFVQGDLQQKIYFKLHHNSH